MTILVDWQIRGLCINQNLVQPFDEDMLNPCSIDIRVGNTAKLRILDGWLDIDLTTYDKDYPYMLYPDSRVLVSSLEIFNFPDDITGDFKLKSSRGREFYQHIKSGWLEPGWNGSTLTMQIMAMDISPLPLYPGLRMGQVIFNRLLERPEKSYKKTGRYNQDNKVQNSKG